MHLERSVSIATCFMAHKMVFGAEAVGETPELASASSNT
jgi:hypothetical protein